MIRILRIHCILIFFSAFQLEIFAQSDCIFDVSTQDDSFIKNVKVFEGYVWDEVEKVAIVDFSELSQLEVKRGGCTHFYWDVKLSFRQDSTTLYDRDFYFEKILTYANQLQGDFDFSEMERLYRSDSFEENSDSSDQIFLVFEQEAYCFMWFSVNTKDNQRIIEIGYYLC